MRFWLGALLLVCAACARASACTCVAPDAKNMRAVAEWYANQPGIDLIFEGKVIKDEPYAGSSVFPPTAISTTVVGRASIVSFAVTRVFRGEKRRNISVVAGGTTCAYGFEMDKTYLVFARSGPDGAFSADICSGTAPIEDAGAALRFLSREQPSAEDLLSPEEYEKHYRRDVLPKRTGSVCGRVLKPDGTPLQGAIVSLCEFRGEDVSCIERASDPNTSSADGHFCIEYADPGRYLLTAERADYDHDARYMAYYPGVYSRGEAKKLEMKAGVRLPDVELTTIHEPLYTIRIRVVTPDGTILSWKNGCGVWVNSAARDPLWYWTSHGLGEDGSYTFGGIPAGKYVITTYFSPDFNNGEKPFPESLKWKPARQDVVVRGDTDVVISMQPTHAN